MTEQQFDTLVDLMKAVARREIDVSPPSSMWPMKSLQALQDARRILVDDPDLWRAAMSSCIGLSSGPNGDGNMRVSVVFPVGHEFPLFDLLSDLFNPSDDL